MNNEETRREMTIKNLLKSSFQRRTWLSNDIYASPARRLIVTVSVASFINATRQTFSVLRISEIWISTPLGWLKWVDGPKRGGGCRFLWISPQERTYSNASSSNIWNQSLVQSIHSIHSFFYSVHKIKGKLLWPK